MILRDLELVNIRSHREARIEFSSGITLFEGDVGSGKSSILMAIEFALFGLGSQRPESLLSQGRPSGSVRLRFEVDGVPYEIKRQLKRAAGRIGQDKKESYLVSDTKIENLAPSELKERVLEVLGFNEPRGPRAASRIFRYAVYTPQGEMRRVLSDAKERLGTIRRAFDMETYDTARENAKALKDHIDYEAARLEGRFAGMAESEAREAEAKREIAAAEERLKAARDALSAAEADEKGAADGLGLLRARAAERDVLRERAAGLGRQAAESKRRGESLRAQADEAAAALAGLEERIGQAGEPQRPTGRADGEISAEIDALRRTRSEMDAADARADVLRRQIADADAELSGIDPDAADRGAAAKRAEASRAAADAAESRAAADAAEAGIGKERDALRARAAERDVLRERASGLGRQAAEARTRGESLRAQADEAAAALAGLEERIGQAGDTAGRPTGRADGEISAEIDALRRTRSEMDAADARADVLRRQIADADAELSGAAGPGEADPGAAAAAVAEAAERKGRIESDLSGARERTEALMRDSAGVSTSLMRVKTEMGQAKRDLDRIASLGSKCHVCETELTADHLARIRGGKDDAIGRCEAEAGRLDAEQARLDAELGGIKSRAAGLEEELRAAEKAEQAAADAEQADAEARRARERLEAERAARSAELEAALAEAAGLRGRYATDRAADRFECDEDDPVGYLLRLREALAAHAEALARLAEMRERAAMMRRDMDARREEAQAAEEAARRAESDLEAAGRDLAAFDGLDAELDDLGSRQEGIDAGMRAAEKAEQAASDAEQAASDAEQAAAEARRARERLESERAARSAELEEALAEAAGLRGRYATDRAADRFDCDEDDPVGYLLRLREALAAHAEALARLAEMRERAAMMRRDMDARREEARAAEEAARRAESDLEAAGRDLAAFDGLDAELSDAELGLGAAQARRRAAEADAAAHAESASGWKSRLEAETVGLEKAKRSRDEHGRHVKYSRWIEEYFMPSVAHIERQVLVSLQAGLDEAYRGWFATLVDDETKTSRIDDTFMPVVDQDGYEIDSAHLSGGERTSVSLAYRLALNTLLRRETRSLRSNLLVLDEPTDGFSKSQLHKVHSILKALEYKQIIIVSHDRELETHADHVFHVTKEGGSSSVRRGTA